MAFQVYPSQRQTTHLFFLKLGMALLAMLWEGAGGTCPSVSRRCTQLEKVAQRTRSTQTQLGPPGLFFVPLPASTQPPEFPSPFHSRWAISPLHRGSWYFPACSFSPASLPLPTAVSPNLLAQKEKIHLCRWADSPTCFRVLLSLSPLTSFSLTCSSFPSPSAYRLTDQIRSDQSLSRVRLFETPWIAARQASLFITNSRSSLRLTSIESVMPSSHLILCRPLLLRPPTALPLKGNTHACRATLPKPPLWQLLAPAAFFLTLTCNLL